MFVSQLFYIFWRKKSYTNKRYTYQITLCVISAQKESDHQCAFWSSSAQKQRLYDKVGGKSLLRTSAALLAMIWHVVNEMESRYGVMFRNDWKVLEIMGQSFHGQYILSKYISLLSLIREIYCNSKNGVVSQISQYTNFFTYLDILQRKIWCATNPKIKHVLHDSIIVTSLTQKI